MVQLTNNVADVMSPPTRGRGLKLVMYLVIPERLNVAPHAGAWIETSVPRPASVSAHVAPHAGAWIETFARNANNNTAPPVAPHAGAWIETDLVEVLVVLPRVAPHAGAWIETDLVEVLVVLPRVAPHAGAWIETCRFRVRIRSSVSPPTRGRGLKRPNCCAAAK